jgi:hypothetical protein
MALVDLTRRSIQQRLLNRIKRVTDNLCTQPMRKQARVVGGFF